jgi:probable rRNA maturation factor
VSENRCTVVCDFEVTTLERWNLKEEFVASVLAAAGEELGVCGEVSVLVVDDSRIHQLNREFRDVDRPTDVLSFSQLEGESMGGLPEEPVLLGDIVVSAPTAVRQAEEYGHTVAREFAFLLVHGFLHLLGYDHETPEEETEMFALQEKILERLSLARRV